MADDPVVKAVSNRFPSRRHGKHPKKVREEKSKAWEEVKFFGMRLMAMLLILYLMFGVLFGLMPMPNEDIKPKIAAGDLMLFYRLDQTYQIGDVIVYTKEDKTYVGRVVAREGDEVDISEDHYLQINGHSVMETDIYYSTGEYEGGISLPVKVPSQCYFLLADLREGGKDSRILGPVNRSEIQGKVMTVIRRSGI